jgi:hypothetical protein
LFLFKKYLQSKLETDHSHPCWYIDFDSIKNGMIIV